MKPVREYDEYFDLLIDLLPESGSLFDYLQTRYGIKLDSIGNLVSYGYEIIDKNKYLLFCLKYGEL